MKEIYYFPSGSVHEALTGDRIIYIPEEMIDFIKITREHAFYAKIRNKMIPLITLPYKMTLTSIDNPVPIGLLVDYLRDWVKKYKYNYFYAVTASPYFVTVLNGRILHYSYTFRGTKYEHAVDPINLEDPLDGPLETRKITDVNDDIWLTA